MNQKIKEIAKKLGAKKILTAWYEIKNIPALVRFWLNERQSICDDFDTKKFKNIYEQERKEYYELKKEDIRGFVMSEWLDNVKKIERYFLNNFSSKFLHNRLIRNTMFVAADGFFQKVELNFLESRMGKDVLAGLLRENKLGAPLITSKKYNTSTNTIHHLYHLKKFETESKVSLSSFSSVVEFGGGYGNLSRIFKKINPGATYIIIDLPVFSFIQSVYLKTILGINNVVIIKNNNDKIQAGKVNIVPLNLEVMVALDFGSIDLFVSTWALSETPSMMQNFIKNLKYFGSKYLLLAYQKNNRSFVVAENIKNLDVDYESCFSAITEYIPNNYYLFARKIR